MGEQADSRAPGTTARWLGVALIVVVLGAVVVAAWQVGVWRSATPAQPVGVNVSGMRLPSLFEAGSSAGGPASAPLADSVPPQASAPEGPLAEGEVEVCGLGRMRQDTRDAEVALWKAIDAPAVPVRDRMRKAMQASGDERERAIGLFFEAFSVLYAWWAEDPRARVRPEARDRRALDALAAMAVTTRSPEVYALALHVCGINRGKGGACPLLSAEQWANLDPDNGAAWAQVLDSAIDARNVSAIHEAAYRMGQSKRMDTYSDPVLRLGIERMPTGLPLNVRYAAVVDMADMTAGVLRIPVHAVGKYCGPGKLAEGSRRDSCAAIGELMVAHGSMPIDLTIGTLVGERAGWPEARLNALKDRSASIEEVTSREVADGQTSCSTMDQRLRNFDERARVGEMAVLRRAIDELPAGAAERARRRWKAAEAKHAAAAASAARGERPAGRTP